MKLIDFHSHIIPRADHGSHSVETSLLQMQYAAESGISRMIATPHFYPYQENAKRFIERRNECFANLKEHLSEDLPEIILGAEVLICDNIESMPDLDLLCIEGTNILLLELPFTDFSSSFVYSVKTLIKNGYTVVLAHADRYNPSNINRLVAVGAKIQLNVDSLSHLILPQHIKSWIADNLVVALGSDIHGPDKQAYKRFIKALKHLGESSDSIMNATNELLDSSKVEEVDASSEEPTLVDESQYTSDHQSDVPSKDEIEPLVLEEVVTEQDDLQVCPSPDQSQDRHMEESEDITNGDNKND